MKKQFVADFEKYRQIKEQYRAARNANDEEGKKAAREALVEFEEMMNLKGEVYRDLYRMYENSLERGNERLDLCETYDYENEAALIACFRENGVEEFTFSSRWSSAVESAWKFIQNGCTLVGMIEINGRFKLNRYDMKCEGYEKVPAYLFRVN